MLFSAFSSRPHSRGLCPVMPDLNCNSCTNELRGCHTTGCKKRKKSLLMYILRSAKQVKTSGLFGVSDLESLYAWPLYPVAKFKLSTTFKILSEPSQCLHLRPTNPECLSVFDSNKYLFHIKSRKRLSRLRMLAEFLGIHVS